MKTIPFLATLGLILIVTGPASGDAIDELNMGLSKTSVFDTPTPAPAAYSDAKPGKNEWLPRAWDGIPPQIPHQTEMYLPVVAADNQCLDCHDVPKYIDKPKNMDRNVKSKSPMSRDHYADEALETVAGARFNCTQCHVPLSNATPLVESTFR
ncbi:MAG: nitrate reductase cytochrome c-type subunit [Thiogranum sp.]